MPPEHGAIGRVPCDAICLSALLSLLVHLVHFDVTLINPPNYTLFTHPTHQTIDLTRTSSHCMLSAPSNQCPRPSCRVLIARICHYHLSLSFDYILYYHVFLILLFSISFLPVTKHVVIVSIVSELLCVAPKNIEMISTTSS